MAESWFRLSHEDQAEALEVAAARSGRPAHLLEKDIWVVWVLSAIYGSPLRKTLTFKGGTSLSKVYRIIERFSEDVDLTYDIRALVPDLLKDGNPIPPSSSQEKKITSAVRSRLPGWIESQVMPTIQAALSTSGLQASLTISGKDNEKLLVSYPALKTGTGYAASSIQLEFGARATGEPHSVHPVVCDIASVIEDVVFPTAQPMVMAAERTFWELALSFMFTACKAGCVASAIHATGMTWLHFPRVLISTRQSMTWRWRDKSQSTNRCSLPRRTRRTGRSTISKL